MFIYILVIFYVNENNHFYWYRCSYWSVTFQEFDISKNFNYYYRRLKVFDVIVTGATYLFSGGRALKLVKDDINLTNSTNPLIII